MYAPMFVQAVGCRAMLRRGLGICGATTLALLLPAGAEAAAGVSADPALYPSFSPNVPTYVARCAPGKSLRLSFSMPDGTKVTVDRRKARGSSFTDRIPVGSGQAVRFTIATGRHSRNYVIRCLPPDFPEWTAKRIGSTQAAWYVVAPCCTKHTYVAVFDTNGVPVWWINTHRPPLDASLAPNGNIIF